LDNIATPNSPKKSFITALKKPARIKIKAHPTTSGVTQISWARVNANVDSYKIIVNQTQEESKPDETGKTRVLQNSVYRLPSNSTQIDIKGLKPETVYQVKIIAELRKKDNTILSVSEPSKTQFLAPPKTPFGVGLFSVGTNTVTIFWNLYFYYMYGENTKTFILLKQRSGGGSYRENQVLEIPFDWNGKKAFNVTGLASCESYELTVVAKTVVAGGFQAESTGAKLFATTQPPPLTNFTITSRSETSISARWQPVGTKLMLEYRGKTSGDSGRVVSFSKKRKVSIEGVKSGETFDITAYSICSDEEGSTRQTTGLKLETVATLATSPVKMELQNLGDRSVNDDENGGNSRDIGQKNNQKNNPKTASVKVSWENVDNSVSGSLLEWFREEPNTTTILNNENLKNLSLANLEILGDKKLKFDVRKFDINNLPFDTLLKVVLTGFSNSENGTITKSASPLVSYIRTSENKTSLAEKLKTQVFTVPRNFSKIQGRVIGDSRIDVKLSFSRLKKLANKIEKYGVFLKSFDGLDADFGENMDSKTANFLELEHSRNRPPKSFSIICEGIVIVGWQR
jgi:hypothetical protein